MMLYEINYWLVKNQQENKFNVVEIMRMLCWMNGHTRQYKSKNKCIIEKNRVTLQVIKLSSLIDSIKILSH